MTTLDYDLNSNDALIIVPPFAYLDRPSLGAHILQTCARRAGFNVRVLYANLILAAEIGEIDYQSICFASADDFLGERLFASDAFGVHPMGNDNDLIIERLNDSNSERKIMESLKIGDIEDKVIDWANKICESVVQCNFKVVGCSTTFSQTAASISLLKRIKSACQEITTIIGGANCEGEMAEGILSLSDCIDYVFSGESEKTFPRFLSEIQEGNFPPDRIIHGIRPHNLDEIPLPDFKEYYEQLDSRLPGSSSTNRSNILLPYECSRGCWWGRCNFCGLNGKDIKIRQKSPDHILSELKELLRHHPNKNIHMVDNIMPFSFFETLIPRLLDDLPEVHIIYEQKSNLSLANVVALKKAGIDLIQPGIESLSTYCLKLMKKGVSASQNIALLRYARSVNLPLYWNFLYAIPGDRIEDYQKMIELPHLLCHLQPPAVFIPIFIDRYSPYYMNPDKFGITNIRPCNYYGLAFPKEKNVNKIAYHFIADYKSASKDNPEIIRFLRKEIENWCALWQSNERPPMLEVIDLKDGRHLLIDTRGLPNTQILNLVTHEQASAVLVGGRMLSEEIKWALERKLIVELDSKYVPLATAKPELLHEFERS
jgi:ribosomal peptide maturation radical SAM protein 1